MSRLLCYPLLAAFMLWAPGDARGQSDRGKESSGTTAAEVSASQPSPPEQAAEGPRFRFPPEQHVWARFPLGSWREIQITTETFGESGEVVNRSVTTQREVLKAVTAETYALEVQATVDLVGKRIVGDWKTRILNLATDGAGEVQRMQQLPDAQLICDGVPVKCQSWQIHYVDDARAMVDQLAYHPELFPHVLWREVREQGRGLPVRLSVQVVSRMIPYRVEGKIIPCSSLHALRQRAKGNSTRDYFVSAEVPGGEVAAWASDFNSQGRLTRWSTLELIGFGQQRFAE